MTDWHGCYRAGWQGVIVPEAFGHPAKMSHGLARRIYEHAFEQNRLAPGATVIDPFGGIGGTAFHAALMGISWVGVRQLWH